MKQESIRWITRAAATGALALAFLMLAWISGRAGFSSLLSTYASKSYDLEAGEVAVNLSSNSPDAHYARGSIFEARNELALAAAEYEQAARSRPEDCVYWLSLARVRELSGDNAGALAAARQAVPLAPYYAQPHWQLGNILVRAGQTGEGFNELRIATASDPRLLPGVMDLAWRLSGGNPQFVEQAVKPQTPQEFKSLGQYLRQLGQLDAALYIYNSSAGRAPDAERLENVAALISAKRYNEAYTLWEAGRQQRVGGAVVDPGFEEGGDLSEAGFGWRTAEKMQGFQLSLDTDNPKEGQTSLKVKFDGESLPDLPVISQLLIVEPNARYQVTFSVRTEAIVSGGLPRIVVANASDNSLLAQSADLPQGTSGWQDYAIEINSNESTTAVQIKLQRQICTTPSCPIFGRLWLDKVWLRKL